MVHGSWWPTAALQRWCKTSVHNNKSNKNILRRLAWCRSLSVSVSIDFLRAPIVFSSAQFIYFASPDLIYYMIVQYRSDSVLAVDIFIAHQVKASLFIYIFILYILTLCGWLWLVYFFSFCLARFFGWFGISWKFAASRLCRIAVTFLCGQIQQTDNCKIEVRQFLTSRQLVSFFCICLISMKIEIDFAFVRLFSSHSVQLFPFLIK